MRAIKFSHNWNNKLNGNVFTTIRKHDTKKMEYYKKARGEYFDVVLKNEVRFKAQLISAESKFFYQLETTVLRLDVGESNYVKIQEIFAKFRITENDSVIILTFKRALVAKH